MSQMSNCHCKAIIIYLSKICSVKYFKRVLSLYFSIYLKSNQNLNKIKHPKCGSCYYMYMYYDYLCTEITWHRSIKPELPSWSFCFCPLMLLSPEVHAPIAPSSSFSKIKMHTWNLI